jgi:hypothetical protein
MGELGEEKSNETKKTEDRRASGRTGNLAGS